MTVPMACTGTRQPVTAHRPARDQRGGSFAQRYGVGTCAVCGRIVTCHKDGSAVYHFPTDLPTTITTR